MEELLLAVVLAVGEFVLDFILYFPWDLLLYFFDGRHRESGIPLQSNMVVIVLAAVLIGAGLGGISLLVLQRTMLPYAWMRMVNIVVAPTVSGLLAYVIAVRRNKARQTSSPWKHVALASILTLTLVLVRFEYAARQN